MNPWLSSLDNTGHRNIFHFHLIYTTNLRLRFTGIVWVVGDTPSIRVLEVLWISTNGFATNPSKFWWWSFWSSTLLGIVFKVVHAWMLPVEKNLEVVWPCVLFQNLELRNSAPGSLQHVFPAKSQFDTLPLDIAKSNDISSSTIPRPFTRVSIEFIPLWELPINLWRRFNILDCWFSIWISCFPVIIKLNSPWLSTSHHHLFSL